MEFPGRLLRGFLRRLWIQYVVRDFGITSVFMAAGSLLLLFGCVFGGWHWLSAAKSLVPTPTGTVMLAVLPIILGIQFLLQAVVADVQNIPQRPLQGDVLPAESNVPEAVAEPAANVEEKPETVEPWVRQRAA